jgi:hypothetical protein
MAVATVVIQQFTSTGPTKTTVTTPRLSAQDSAAPGTTYPIPIPASSFHYSYWMSLHLTITAMNAATLLNNHQFYTDGTIGWNYGSGGGLLICRKSTGDNGVPVASYQIAAGTLGTTGYSSDDVTNGHAYYKSGSADHAAPAGAGSYTSGSTLLIDSTSHTIAEGFKGAVLQAKVDTAANGAVRGAQSAETLTFVYDEV